MTDIARLEHLKAVLEGVRDKRQHFDMDHWSSTYTLVENPDDPFCGTSGCALGWACHDREFQAQGLILTRGRHHRPEPEFTDRRNQRVYRGYEAAMAFFDLPENAAFYLFHPGPSAFANHDVRCAIARVDHMITHYRNRCGWPATVPVPPAAEPVEEPVGEIVTARELEPA